MIEQNNKQNTRNVLKHKKDNVVTVTFPSDGYQLATLISAMNAYPNFCTIRDCGKYEIKNIYYLYESVHIELENEDEVLAMYRSGKLGSIRVKATTLAIENLTGYHTGFLSKKTEATYHS